MSRQFQCIFILTKLPSDNVKIRIFEIVFSTYKVSFAVVNSYGLKRGLRWGSETFTLVIDFFLQSQYHGLHLEGGDVECCHIILSTALILVVDYVFSHIVVWAGVLDLSLSSSVVNGCIISELS